MRVGFAIKVLCYEQAKLLEVPESCLTLKGCRGSNFQTNIYCVNVLNYKPSAKLIMRPSQGRLKSVSFWARKRNEKKRGRSTLFRGRCLYWKYAPILA